MKKPSEIFKSIRFAKGEPRDKPHLSTDNEEHYTVGEKEWNQQVQHAKKMAMQEKVKDKFDIGEYDQEGDMAKSDLRSIIANAQKMHDMIDDADNLPEWVQSKITKAEDYISTVANYMTSEMSEEVKDEYARKVDKYLKKKYNKEEVEHLEEGRPSQRHPLEGHEYHKKSDEALIHIAKDAHKAAEAMKGHNTTAENKYRDQANDSATVRHFRKTSGMPDWYKKKYGHMKESFRPMDEPKYSLSIQARQKKADDANKPPFDGPYKKTTGTVTDKSGAKHSPMSVARNLARQALKKQAEKMPVKESLEESRKGDIVKEVFKKAKKKNDETFQSEPELGSSVVKSDN